MNEESAEEDGRKCGGRWKEVRRKKVGMAEKEGGAKEDGRKCGGRSEEVRRERVGMAEDEGRKCE